MNASACLLLAASLCVLAAGCATDPDWRLRAIEINADQTESDSPFHPGLSPSLATNVFHEVTGHLGYAVYPHEHRDPAHPKRVEYDAHFTPPNTSSVDLALVIDGRYITFRGETDLDPYSVAELQKAMKQLRESLDEHQVKYSVRVMTLHPFLEKS